MSGVSGGPEPKRGDEVEFSGKGVVTAFSDGRLSVFLSLVDTPVTARVPLSSVRVVVPPLNEGDTIYESADLTRLPGGSVVMPLDPAGAVGQKLADGQWFLANGWRYSQEPILPVRVLWVGGDSE